MRTDHIAERFPLVDGLIGIVIECVASAAWNVFRSSTLGVAGSSFGEGFGSIPPAGEFGKGCEHPGPGFHCPAAFR